MITLDREEKGASMLEEELELGRFFEQEAVRPQ